MSNERESAHEGAAKIAHWEAELNKLKAKLRVAKPLEKIALYDEIKALQTKISLARAEDKATRQSS